MKKKIEILKGFIKNPDYINDFKEAERLLLLADEVYRATIHDFQVLKIKIDKGFIPENSFSEVKVKTGEIVDLVKLVITCVNSKFQEEVKNRFGAKVAQSYSLKSKIRYSEKAKIKSLIKDVSKITNIFCKWPRKKHTPAKWVLDNLQRISSARGTAEKTHC
jgi:hypothetical protein